MTWSYDPTLASDRDKVRFEIQDTETSDQLFSDEEIDARLAVASSINATVIDLAKRLMLRFARLVDTTVGKVSESASQRYQAYKDIVDKLERDDAAHCMPIFGGTTVANNEALDQNTALVQPKEKIDGDTNLGDAATFGGGSG